MAFGSNPKPQWQQSLADAASRVEAELKDAVRTIDEQVVPEVRRHSSTALRTLAQKLNSLAQHMDDARAQKPEDPAA